MSKPNFKPWRFAGQGILIDDDENEIVLGNVYSDDQIGWLIYAAPDLYAALREAREWILGEGSIVPERLVGRIGAALAKAEGR